jgi:hypothetical protein
MHGSRRRRTRRVRGAAILLTVALAALLLIASALVACGGSGSSSSGASSGGSPAAGQGGAAGGDSFLTAWPKAQESMAAVADDAVLVAAGTTGLALADVPDAWSFTFFSPSKKSVYSVDVEHGVAAKPRELGAATKSVDVGAVTDAGSINVGGADAVVKARAFGERSGKVPRNVVVGGVFAELPGAAAAGYKTGVWTVTFATGTDLADAQKYEVDMMTGKVTKAK